MGLLPVPTKEEYIDEEELAPENDVEGPIIEHIVGGCCSDPGDVAGCSSYVKGIRTSVFLCLFKSILQLNIHHSYHIISVTEHGLNLLPPPILSDDELDSVSLQLLFFILLKFFNAMSVIIVLNK